METNLLCTKKMVKMASTATEKGPKSWDAFGESGDILGICIEKFPRYEDIIRAKLVSKYFKDYIESEAFCRLRGIARPIEASLTSLFFSIEYGYWQCSGFDLDLGRWRRLPPLTYLPAPQLEQQNLVAGGGGLFCVNVSQTFDEEQLIVCNPLTQENVMLPPLHSRRNPVLMHLLANPATNSYKVIVAGSSSDTGDGLSTCTEVFDSLLWKWTSTGDIPGRDFCLNEYQTGVCKNGILYCVGFLKGKFNVECKIKYQKSVLAYELEKGQWMRNWSCKLPLQTGDTAHLAQLVECNKDVYLFLEYSSLRKERPFQLIAKLETFAHPGGPHAVAKWKTVMTRTIERQSRCAVAEYTCVPYGVGELCIFNSIEHTGVVYDILSQQEGDGQELPPPPAMHYGYGFHSLNPLSFTCQLSFYGKCVSHSHAVMEGKTKESDLTMSDSQECGRKRVCREPFPEICPGYTPNHLKEDDQICNSLPDDILKEILLRCDYEALSRMRLASKLTKQFTEKNCFQVLRGVLTALHFMVKNGVWQGSGFHLTMKKWMRLPPFSSPLKAVNSSEDGSEDYLIAGGGGLLCLLNVSDSKAKRLVIVYNPLTMKVRVLPVIKFCRNPMLMHLLSNPRTMSYKVIVAGDLGVEGDLSIRSGIFDSVTSEWLTTSGISELDFTLSQYQTGACIGRILYCIADCRSEERKHVLQCNVQTGEWLDWSIPLPHPLWDATQFYSVYTDAQLVECDDSIFLFSRRGLSYKEQRLDKLVLGCRAEHHWEHMWRRPEEIGRYPEYTCTPFGDDKLCVFNTNEMTGVVYDIHDHSFSELPSPLKRLCGMTYDIQDHLGFSILPSYEQQP